MQKELLDKLPETPMWKQYRAVKIDYLDCLMLYRMGDFYEMFLDDAEEAAAILSIALTARHKNSDFPVAMCGVPFHSATAYINKLLAAGKRVAICEQTEAAGTTKGIVKREVVRVVSPGMAYDHESLKEEDNNYLLVLDFQSKQSGYYCALDISTGECSYSNFLSQQELFDELAILNPKELILSEKQFYSEIWKEIPESITSRFQCVSPVPAFYFDSKSTYENLCAHFSLHNLESFGLSKEHSALAAIGAAFRKTQDNQKLANLCHLQTPQERKKNDLLQLDESTIEHLDIFPKADRNPNESLFFHLNKTVTAMGARYLKNLLARPLNNKESIEARQTAIQTLIENGYELEEIRNALKGIRDLERLMAKLGLKTAGPRDLLAIKEAFSRLPAIKKQLQQLKNSALLQNTEKNISDFKKIHKHLENCLKEECPNHARDGEIFQAGWHKELDELIELTSNGRQYISNKENEERKKTGINSLKIKFNKVFGYFIEVTKTNLHLVPKHYIRKQTTANGERYITEELKKFEDKILRAQEKKVALEAQLFEDLVEDIAKDSKEILQTARELAKLDCLLSLALVASEQSYVKPEIVSDSVQLDIQEGRHPAIENIIGKSHYIANSIDFSTDDRMFLITGPNMAGKSTFMRQIALITLLAHTGSFVPASSAKIGIVDRIASRVGASDRIGKGQSTFMVEMNEMARILNQATEKSLLIIDEIGRGTSTYDGMSLAWAIAEEITTNIKARTLFATHYHELTDLESQFPSLKNISVQVSKTKNDITFLHKVEKGKANGSFGVEVAQLAGLPEHVLNRAKTILNKLESGAKKQNKSRRQALQEDQQMDLFSASPKVIEKTPKHLEALEVALKEIDINKCTPMDALIKLKSMQDYLH